MKKILFLILILSILWGCSQKIDTKRIAVLNKDSESLILFLDNDNNVLAKKNIDYADHFFYCNDIFYFSNDGSNYKGINIYNLKDSNKLTNIVGSPLLYNDDGSYITYQNGQAYVVDDFGMQTALAGFLCSYAYNDDYFYMLDYSNFLYIYSLDDYSLVKRERIESNNYINLSTIAQNVYLVNDKGYTLLEPSGKNKTYLYINDFNEILNNYSDMLFVIENKEQVVYRVSFSKNQMELTVVNDEIYYRQIIYETEFSEYYGQGYDVVFYREIY